MMTRVRQWKPLEFRDGFREVPDHLAALMTGIETFRLTYREALEKANNRQLADYLNKQQDVILRRHFEEKR